LWSVFDPMEYATLECFLEDPAKAWRLFRALGRTCRGRQPNPAHAALAALEAGGWLAGIVTQNVDGLHQAAGSRRVIEIHGSAERLRCPRCGTAAPLEDALLDEAAPVPRCASCGAAVKPDVVLFGEAVRDSGAVAELVSGCDVLLVAGTSAAVYPAAAIPDRVRAHGGRVLEFNLERCLDADVFVPGRVGTTLPATAEAIAAIAQGGRT
jgi:NAD-dependent deacetylase